MIKLNAGISRKVGERNFGSRGASVNLELELESHLIGDPGGSPINRSEEPRWAGHIHGLRTASDVAAETNPGTVATACRMTPVHPGAADRPAPCGYSDGARVVATAVSAVADQLRIF